MLDFQEEDFRHSVDYLEGFGDFMEMLPDASSSDPAPDDAHEDAFLSSFSAPLPEALNAISSAAQPVSEQDRRQSRNRLAQRRFRERQKVSNSEASLT